MYTEQDLNEFVQGYIECALWAEGLESGTDIHPEALDDMRVDCINFMFENAADLEDYMVITARDLSDAGHDFWLTRNGAGTGFWDHAAGTVGELLTRAAEATGPCNLYTGLSGRSEYVA